ncbi:hypothetical protein EV700_3107 [Fluviicoccus keumensis]|uniref:Uncharacterized protein n=1 Tax=Fluviicoccus keumensis TaxID=1435465 RepID=A0A4Q7YJ92_9GAMM|nr:hypothetical protein [Fluviicoccus keumensis]RZU36894.1 hypothetical protein EV700_3107 [Fluviicoccus keumensis]
MGIDALVFCDCLEKGCLRRPPRPEWQVYVQEDGCRECASTEPRLLAAFGNWHETACAHDYGILIHRRLDLPATSPFRQALADAGDRLGLVRRLLCSGDHDSGCLDMPLVGRLAEELKWLRQSLPAHPAAEAGSLLQRLEELAATALAVSKPLVF